MSRISAENAAVVDSGPAASMRGNTKFHFRKSTALLGAVLSLAFFAPGPVPAPWVDADVGGPGQAGSGTYDPATSTWVLKGGGGDIWGTADQFNYAYMPVTGDAVITAHVASLTDSTGGTTEDQWSKVGVMFRDGTAGGAMDAFECFTGNNGTDFQFRSATGGGAANNGQTGGGSPHKWVRVTRTGNAFQGAWSDDGNTWTNHGAAQTIAIPSAAKVGLAVCAHNNGTLSIGTFDNVTVTDGTGLYYWPLQPPTNLTATAGFNSVTLNWNAVSGATSYQVFRSQTAGGPYSLPPLATVNAPTTTYRDTTAMNPNTYYYVVRALSAIGSSANSNEASCTPNAPLITVSPTAVQVAENAGTATFTVTLAGGADTGTVTVPVTSADGTKLKLSGSGTSGTMINLQFPAGTTSQIVTVTGVDAGIGAPPPSYTVMVTFGTVTSTNGASQYQNYNSTGQDMNPVTCTILPDAPGLIVNPASVSITNGGTAVTFTVSLASTPSAGPGSVTLNFSVTDPNLATVSPPTTTAAGFNTPVTVTVTPLLVNTQTTYTGPFDVAITTSGSTDAGYAALGGTLVPVNEPVNLPPLTKVWGKCGLLGLEGFLPLGLLLAWRHRRRVIS